MTEPTTTIRNITDIAWKELPGHFGGALTKPLVDPKADGAKKLRHAISVFAPMAYSARHTHAAQEQVFHVLEGEGLFEYGDQKQVLRTHDYVFIPPGVEHAISNVGLGRLVFLVITSAPPEAA